MKHFDLYRILQPKRSVPDTKFYWMTTEKVGTFGMAFDFPVFNEITVYWGDETSNTYNLISDEESLMLNHTYSLAGAKEIMASGTGFLEMTELMVSSNSLTSLDISVNTKLTRLNCASNSLTSIVVNSVLSNLVAHGNMSGVCDISMQTPPAPPTGQGLTDKATLISRGWTVTTD